MIILVRRSGLSLLKAHYKKIPNPKKKLLMISLMK